MSAPIKFSIVTASYNRATMIEVAIKSVSAQSYPNVEHLIIDGASNDETLDALKNHPHLIVKSEPDKGVYDAWNKGITLATGDVIGILNSDDFYADGVFEYVGNIFESNPDIMIVRGETETVYQKDDGSYRLYKKTNVKPSEKPMSITDLNIFGPKINGCFIRKNLIDNVGTFDLAHGLSADCDFMIRLAKQKPHTAFVNRVLYKYCAHEGALTHNFGTSNTDKINEEKLSLAEQYMQDEALGEAEKRTIKQQHTRKCIADALKAILHGKVKESYALLSRGVQHNKRFVPDGVKSMAKIIIFQLKIFGNKYWKS